MPSRKGKPASDGESHSADLARRLRIVAITPPDADPASIPGMAVRAVSGGATAVMLRLPGAPVERMIAVGRPLAELAPEHDFLFIFNGPPDVAELVGAGAVHLGVRTVKPREARRMLDASGSGQMMAIGYSVHAPFEDHLDEIATCDYITYSPVYPTSSKKGAVPLGTDEFMRAAQALPVPVVALGGIGPVEAHELAAAGCCRVAVISSIMGRDDPATGAKQLSRIIASGDEGAGTGQMEDKAT